MKKLTFLIALIVFSLTLSGQNSFRYPITIGMGAPGTVTGGSIILKGLTSGTATIRVPAVAGTGTIFQLPANNGTSGYALTTDGSGVTTWTDKTTETRNVVADSLNAFRSNAEDGSTVYPELADTIPQVYFALGGGLAADTACFNNNALAGAFYNEGSDTLVITQLMAVLKEGTGTETIAVQVAWDVNMLDGTPTNLNSSALTVTSLTGGTEDTSFANSKIPPNVWVWCVLSGASKDNKPTFLSVTLSGHKSPKY